VITGVPNRYDPSRRVAAGFFGVEPEIVRERGGPVAVIGDMWQMTKQTAVALAYFPVKVYNTAYNLVTGKPRDVYGPMSIVGASRAAGEIASTNQIDAAAKVASLFTVLGAVNLFVALFNFVPLLPLDGGHVAAAFYEAGQKGDRPRLRTTRPRTRGHREAAADCLRRRWADLDLRCRLDLGRHHRSHSALLTW
jgi:membrane-associated protease RseP (regulator of RpoE activity)